MRQTILLTGFEPFNRERINPAWEAVQALAGWHTETFDVEAIQLPCVFGRAHDELAAAITRHAPDIVIAVGQAGGRSEICVERVAINIDDAPIPDNAGTQPVDRAIVTAGPAAYFSTLPIKAIVHAIRGGGIPASVSQTAGTFVCNHLFYALMDQLAQPGAPSGARGGFIHVPYLPRQAAAHPGQPSMALTDIIEALRIAIRISAAGEADLRTAEGRID
ncbi:MAG: pyroglutamyl-peptidase I [Herminiimonas sp.]|nr:pyroglutamyl-peptidase I [Herminiimonas sp.]